MRNNHVLPSKGCLNCPGRRGALRRSTKSHRTPFRIFYMTFLDVTNWFRQHFLGNQRSFHPDRTSIPTCRLTTVVSPLRYFSIPHLLTILYLMRPLSWSLLPTPPLTSLLVDLGFVPVRTSTELPQETGLCHTKNGETRHTTRRREVVR